MKRKINLTLWGILLIVVFCFVGCGKKSITGTYNGDAGSVLVLNSDETCTFINGGSEKESQGEWHLTGENGLYIQLENWNYSLYAELGGEDGFVLKSDNSNGYWDDEYFSKQ